MKKAIALAGCISLFSILSIGQCKNILKKVDLSVMKEYEHCAHVKVAQMYSGDNASFKQQVKNSKRYRLMTVNQSRLGDIKVHIISSKGDTLGIKNDEGKQVYWDLMVEKTQVIEIKISIPKQSSPTKINAFGCVAVILGDLENMDLVTLDSENN